MNKKNLVLASIVIGIFSFIAFRNPLTFYFAALVHYGSGIYAIYVIAKKGYLAKVSIVLWLLVGWWFLIVLIGLGPIALFFAALLPEKKRCTHCKELINKDATRCPKCQGDLLLTASIKI